MVAEEQTAGRGRRGRSWLSPPGRNLTLSVALRPRLAAGVAWQLAVAARPGRARPPARSIAAVDLKWPNDLVCRRRREARRPAGRDDHRRRSRHLGGGRASGSTSTGARAEMPRRDRGRRHLAGRPRRAADRSRRRCSRALLDELDAELVALEAGRSPLARYRDACTTLGSEVAVETSTGRLTGRAVEVDPHGALVVEAGSAARRARHRRGRAAAPGAPA